MGLLCRLRSFEALTGFGWQVPALAFHRSVGALSQDGRGRQGCARAQSPSRFAAEPQKAVPMRRSVLCVIVATAFALLVGQSGPASALIGCSVAEVLCVNDCGGGRLCKTHCSLKRRVCDSQKAQPQVGTRPPPTLPPKKIGTGAPKPLGVK